MTLSLSMAGVHTVLAAWVNIARMHKNIAQST